MTKLSTITHAATLALTLHAAAGCALLPKKDAGAATPVAGPVAPGQPGYVDPGAYQGALHQQHAGKILFASAPLRDDGDDSAALQTYTLGQPLYMRAFSAESPRNIIPTCGLGRVLLKADVNGAPTTAPADLQLVGIYLLNDDVLTKRWVHSLSGKPEFSIVPPSATDSKQGARTIKDFNSGVVTRLREGTNDLRLVAQLDCERAGKPNIVLAEGHLTVEVPPGGLAAYLGAHGPRLAASPHKDNAKLGPQIREVVGRLDGWDTEQYLGASVVSAEWIPIRHKLSGRIVEEQIDAKVIVRKRSETNPEACRTFDMAFRRDPAGGPLRFAGSTNPQPYPCSLAPT